MRQLAERAYFVACLTLGRLLRSAKYSKTLIASQAGERHVRKRRAFYAPFLIWLGRPFFRMLDAGVRVLPQRDWEERERLVHRTLRGASIRVDADGTLILPLLPGETLANVLEDADAPARKRAITLAVVALAELHARGLTHGDAMAENVVIDLEAGVAHWLDFENLHDASRSAEWRRSDDVRALLTTCVLRVDSNEALGVILHVYADEGVASLLAMTFASVWRRALAFHLGQAGLSFLTYREIARWLRAPALVSQPDVA